jgi:2-polyprenyl-3-methyl-5-hydroxy-6-metoxy-1,4-benzoquinol methylase
MLSESESGTIRGFLDRAWWRCPACRGGLQEFAHSLHCTTCDRHYHLVDGIPDFRLSIPSWLDVAADTATARKLADAQLPLDELVREVFARQTASDPQRVERRTREILDSPKRLQEDLDGWLKSVIADGPFLDLGCGGGMLLAAAAEKNPSVPVIGIDVSMTWLVVAKRMVTERGGRAVLAAAMAEALPLASESLPAVVSLDVIEHVGTPDAYLAEIDRILQVGGRAALSTPNRFSLTAEPHVFVWGVGWLPQRYQRAFVRWRSGKPYDYTVLMSSFGLRQKMRRNTGLRFRIQVPQVASSNVAHFGARKAAAARIYNALADWWLFRPLFLCIAPFFRLTGSKVSASLFALCSFLISSDLELVGALEYAAHL